LIVIEAIANTIQLFKMLIHTRNSLDLFQGIWKFLIQKIQFRLAALKILRVEVKTELEKIVKGLY